MAQKPGYNPATMDGLYASSDQLDIARKIDAMDELVLGVKTPGTIVLQHELDPDSSVISVHDLEQAE